MQGLSCRTPSVARGVTAVTLETHSQASDLVTQGTSGLKSVPTVKRNLNLGTPIRVPVDSNGQRLCPTPKSTRGTPKARPSSLSFSSPGGHHNLRYQSVTSTFQPLETIQSPEATNTQVRRVLVDLNGQWASETPKPSKQTATPKVYQTPKVGITTTCLEPIVPRALFNENGSNPAPNSVKRPIMMHKISTESLAWDPCVGTKPSTLLLQSPAIRVRIHEEDSTQTSCIPAAAHETPKMENVKKRARDEDENEDKDEDEDEDEESRKRSDDTSRVTRSKAEADRIALFLRSPAVRVPVLSPKRKQKDCATSSNSLVIKLPAEKKPRYSKTGTSDSQPAEKKPRYVKTGTSDSLPAEKKLRYANTGTSGSLAKLPVEKKPRYATAMEGDATKKGDADNGQQSLEIPATIPHEVFPVILEEDLEPLEVVKCVWAVTSSSPAIRVRVHSPGHRESLLRSPLVVKKSSSSIRKSSSSNTGRSSLKQKASTKKNNLATKKKLAALMDSEM